MPPKPPYNLQVTTTTTTSIMIVTTTTALPGALFRQILWHSSIKLST
jgi:hypothetical protein